MKNKAKRIYKSKKTLSEKDAKKVLSFLAWRCGYARDFSIDRHWNDNALFCLNFNHRSGIDDNSEVMIRTDAGANLMTICWRTHRTPSASEVLRYLFANKNDIIVDAPDDNDKYDTGLEFGQLPWIKVFKIDETLEELAILSDMTEQ